MASNTITKLVQEKYGQTATAGLSSDNDSVRAVAQAFGYSAEELASIPAEANMGLSCGNPLATANLKSGEVVVDLGSGGGLDVFLAASKVGPTGRAIGIDMTPEMIALARKNAAKGDADGKPYTNVEFHQSTIDRIPLPDNSVDVIISNCVINLATDKRAVFKEMFRVLKPGGRVAVSDIALKQPLPDDLAKDLMAYVGCIAGAIEIDEYNDGLAAAGFKDVAIVNAGADLNAYSQVEGQSACCTPAKAPEPATSGSYSCCSSEPKKVSLNVGNGCCSSNTATLVHEDLTAALKTYDVNEYAASVRVFAVKP